MSVTQGKLFPSQDELAHEEAIAPKKEKVKKETETAKVNKTAKAEEIEKVEKFQPVEKVAIVNVNVRDFPSMSTGKILRVLMKGEKIKVLENQGEWSKVPEGYIMSEFLH